MKNEEITDPVFLSAVEAIDAGNISRLTNLLDLYPELITERLNYPNGGYFKDPYLLWFVADNPIRVSKLPGNVVDITRLLVQYVKEKDTKTLKEQLDYTLELVVSGYIPRKRGVQIELIDLLLDEGATLNGIMGAITNNNIDAAKHLLKRGDKLTLAGAVGLDRTDDVKRLISNTTAGEKLTALAVAAFYDKPETIAYLLNAGIHPNGYPPAESGFHTHATPLHQAVSAGSLKIVKLLVETGADPNKLDTVYNGTPLGWAEHLLNEEMGDQLIKNNLKLIVDYLRPITSGR